MPVSSHFPSKKRRECEFSEVLLPKKYTRHWRVRKTLSRSTSKSLTSGSGFFVGLNPNASWGGCPCLELGSKTGVCLLCKEPERSWKFLKQRRRRDSFEKLPSHCIDLCNHHKGTYQHSKSISHQLKQTLKSANEAELQPRRVRLGFCGLGWWRQTMQLYADGGTRHLTGTGLRSLSRNI